MGKILVPTDFSSCANDASQVAIGLSKQLDYELCFLHLMDIPVDWIKLGGNDQKKLYPDITSRVNKANVELDKLVTTAEHEGVKAGKFLQFNSNYKFVINHVKEFSFDLIVMGSHGADGIKEILLGSIAQRIVRLSSIPVIVVKEGVGKLKVNKIVFASDFEIDVYDGFKKILKLAKTLGAQLQLLFVNTPANFTETEAIDDKLKIFMREGNGMITGSTVVNSYEFEEALGKFCKKNGDLLAMVTHGIKGSLTERIINHLTIPVLSVNFQS